MALVCAWISGAACGDADGTGGSSSGTGAGGSGAAGATGGGAGGAGANGGAGETGGAGANGGDGGAGGAGANGADGGTGGAGANGGDGGTGGAGGMGPAEPTGLSATVDGGLVELTWTNPDPSSGNTVVRVVRTLDAPPTGPSDPTATVVYEGPAEMATEPTAALLPDMPDAARTYHYAAYGCTPAADCETAGSSTTLALTLTQALVGGGYNIIWRHASANVCSDNLALGTAATTSTPDWWKSCETDCTIATARQMNAAGVTEATVIGQDLTALGVPFSRVLSSEYCRNTQTAELMALGPVIEERQDITYFVYDEANRCANSEALLATPPDPGTNVALIGHAGFVCPVLDSLAWGEAAIYKPDGSGGSLLITRVPWNGWMALP